ncbi:MAG TPA: hypothetical protein VFY50_02790 [Candidatus Nitrosocosmicus sp.]|nr:hypothetical protein [Candidatus Nitrosocosmicus sp.]
MTSYWAITAATNHYRIKVFFCFEKRKGLIRSADSGNRFATMGLSNSDIDRLRQFNEFLDEPATTFLEEKPSRRQIFETIINSMYAHRNHNKMGTIETWKTDPIDWHMVFISFKIFYMILLT